MTVASRLPTNCINWNATDETPWVFMFSTATAGIAAPDATLSAFEIVEDGTLAVAHYAYHQSAPLAQNINYIFSTYAKASNRTWLQITFSYFGSPRANFNLSTGAVGTVVGTTSYGVVSIGSGWHFCWMGLFADNPGWQEAQILACSADDTTDYDGLDQSSIFFWRPSLISGSVPDMFAPYTTEVPRTTYYVGGTPPA